MGSIRFWKYLCEVAEWNVVLLFITESSMLPGNDHYIPNKSETKILVFTHVQQTKLKQF